MRLTALPIIVQSLSGDVLSREVLPVPLDPLPFRDFAAEDAVQEAFMAAVIQWPREGIPDNPRGWLIQVAARRMTDYLRSEMARRRRESTAATETGQQAPAADSANETEQDDTLTLLFMCCHPALTQSSAIALTLQAVGGLTTAEIAKAFLVPEATMALRMPPAPVAQHQQKECREPPCFLGISIF